MMIEDFLRSSIALDIIKKTEARIDEDSSVMLYPFTRTLKIVEAQSLGIFRLCLVAQYGKSNTLR